MTATAAPAPTRSWFDRWKGIALATLKVLLDPDTSPRCAATAFFGFLSFFPALATIALIYGIVTLPFAFWLMKTFFEEMPNPDDVGAAQ